MPDLSDSQSGTTEADTCAGSGERERSDAHIVMLTHGDEIYGIDIRFVQEIVHMLPITEAPDGSSEFVGMVELRGLTIPIADFATYLGYSSIERSAETRILVIERDGSRIGLIADEVTEVKPLNASQIVAGASLCPPKHDSIMGVAKIDGQLVSLVTLERLLDAADDFEEANVPESAAAT